MYSMFFFMILKLAEVRDCNDSMRRVVVILLVTYIHEIHCFYVTEIHSDRFISENTIVQQTALCDQKYAAH